MIIRRKIKLIRMKAIGSDGEYWGTIQCKTWSFLYIPVVVIETLV